MTDTPNLGLPLLASSQAQKHVTVNEALARLDALVALSVRSRAVSDPPGGASEGDRYLVAGAASGDWTGRDGDVAIFVNGGWDFVTPKAGWRAWVEDEGVSIANDGVGWRGDSAAVSAGGASTSLNLVEFDHTISAGPSDQTSAVIPANSLVLAVTGRVTAAIGGASSWSLGVAGAEVRYGSGLGAGLNSYTNGLTGTPMAYYAATPLVLTAAGGDFTGGAVRLCIHTMVMAPADAV